MAQLVALMSGVVLGVAEVVGSNLAGDKIFIASIGSVDSLYPSITASNLCLLLQKEQNVKGGEGPSGKQAVGINNGTR